MRFTNVYDHRRAVTALLAVGLAGGGAAVALADEPPAVTAAATPTIELEPAAVNAITDGEHDEQVRRVARLEKRLAGIRGEKAPLRQSWEIRDWSLDHLRAHAWDVRFAIREARQVRARERREARAAARAQAAAAAQAPSGGAVTGSGSAPNGHLAAIAQCESGGNPAAVSPDGQYRGKYQFSVSTWQAVGGSGDPAAASEAEQDQRAAMLYARAGAGQWPVCGS